MNELYNIKIDICVRCKSFPVIYIKESEIYIECYKCQLKTDHFSERNHAVKHWNVINQKGTPCMSL